MKLLTKDELISELSLGLVDLNMLIVRGNDEISMKKKSSSQLLGEIEEKVIRLKGLFNNPIMEGRS